MFDWISGFLEQSGYLGIALLMFLENVFPPIPSELIMPLAGFTAGRGDLNIILVILSGSLGSLAGAAVWYYVGRWIGIARLKAWAGRHGRWLTVSSKEIDKASHWFGRHGGKAVLIGRLVPTVRTLISVPAGIAGMPIAPFLLYSGIGTVAWTSLLALAGYLLQAQFSRVSEYLNPVSNLVVAVIVAIYLYRVVTFRPAKGNG